MNLENPNSMNSEETALQDTKPEDKEMDLREIAESTNIASHLSDDELRTLGNLCKRGFEYDQESRSDFMDNLKDWQKLATLMRETKNFPWEDASNIKYPLITTAAMQFSARSYPTLVPSDGMIVKGRVVGKDPDGAKNKKANRVAKYLSWQIMFEMDNW